MTNDSTSLDAIRDIRNIMDRSSRFISLSGLSGIGAGMIALTGAYIAGAWIRDFRQQHDASSLSVAPGFDTLVIKLLGLALVVLAGVMLTAFYFTWRKAKHDKVSLLDKSSRRLIINLFIPVVAGGLFILGMLYHGVWQFVVPASLVFYGLGCVNGSKYTFTDIRYLGYLEIILGLIALFYVGYGLQFWAIGFGLLHIVYGCMMWWKYEKSPATS